MEEELKVRALKHELPLFTLVLNRLLCLQDVFHLPPQCECNAWQCTWRHPVSLSPVLRHDASSAVSSVDLTEQNTKHWALGRGSAHPGGVLESRRGKVTAPGSLPTVLWVLCRATSCTGWGGARGTSTAAAAALLLHLSHCWGEHCDLVPAEYQTPSKTKRPASVTHSCTAVCVFCSTKSSRGRFQAWVVLCFMLMDAAHSQVQA